MRKFVSLLGALYFASTFSQMAFAESFFKLEDKSCLILGAKQGEKKVTSREVSLSTTTCHVKKDLIVCEFKTGADPAAIVEFTIEGDKGPILMIYSVTENIRILIDKKTHEFRYAESYKVPVSPFLITKSCYGVYTEQAK